MYKDIYVFPAVITKFDEKDYNVTFPDFEEIITYGESLEKAYFMAEDALKLCIFDLHEDGKEIPVASELEDIKSEKNQIVTLVKVDLKKIVREYDNKAVKKTLTIPSWLNKEAERSHINFSQVLKEALIKHLNL